MIFTHNGVCRPSHLCARFIPARKVHLQSDPKHAKASRLGPTRVSIPPARRGVFYRLPAALPLPLTSRWPKPVFLLYPANLHGHRALQSERCEESTLKNTPPVVFQTYTAPPLVAAAFRKAAAVPETINS